jgi:hypothetical protein
LGTGVSSAALGGWITAGARRITGGDQRARVTGPGLVIRTNRVITGRVVR